MTNLAGLVQLWEDKTQVHFNKITHGDIYFFSTLADMLDLEEEGKEYQSHLSQGYRATRLFLSDCWAFFLAKFKT